MNISSAGDADSSAATERAIFNSSGYLIDRMWLTGPSLKIPVERVSGCKIYRHDPRLAAPPWILIVAGVMALSAFRFPGPVTISLGLSGIALIVIVIAKFRYSYELRILTPAGEQTFAHYADRGFVNQLSAAVDQAIAKYVEQKQSTTQTGPGAEPPLIASPSRVERLERLAALRDRGALTDAQFESEKARVLGE